MRIATWNVNSVKQRVPRLLPWLDEREPDVVCLQETKLADDAFRELLGEELSQRGYEVAVHGEATSAATVRAARIRASRRRMWEGATLVMSADHASVIRYFGAGRTIVQARVEGVQTRGLG